MVKKKSPGISPGLVPQPHGGALRRGITKNGGAGGRPPDEFKKLCQQLASRAKTFEVAKAIIDNPTEYPSLWTGALKWATENGYGKATEKVDHTITVLQPEERQQRIAALLEAGKARVLKAE